jgi:hypothetical protein
LPQVVKATCSCLSGFMQEIFLVCFHNPLDKISTLHAGYNSFSGLGTNEPIWSSWKSRIVLCMIAGLFNDEKQTR